MQLPTSTEFTRIIHTSPNISVITASTWICWYFNSRVTWHLAAASQQQRRKGEAGTGGSGRERART